MSNLRYTVGEQVMFLRVNFEHGSPRFSSLFLPWEDTLKSLESFRLTCAEHHKVPDCHDSLGSLVHDGFVFVQEDGTRWNNQYPTASYGQLDDRANYMVRRSHEGLFKEGMSRQELLETFGLFTDARIYLENLHSGVTELKNAGKTDYAAKLEEHIADVVQLVEVGGMSVRVEPHENSILAKMGQVSVFIERVSLPQAQA